MISPKSRAHPAETLSSSRANRSSMPTMEQVRAKGIEAAKKYSNGAVKAILQKFGVGGMSALAEKDRAAFLAELERLGEGVA